jgi:hypothetical protein
VRCLLGPFIFLRSEFKSLPDPFERLVNQSESLAGIHTRLWNSVDEFPATVDEFDASVDEFGSTLEQLQTIVGMLQATVNKYQITVDGQVVSRGELLCTFNISTNSVDEPGTASREYKISVHPFERICSLKCVILR